jgi:hypothetical protein
VCEFPIGQKEKVWLWNGIKIRHGVGGSFILFNERRGRSEVFISVLGVFLFCAISGMQFFKCLKIHYFYFT